MRTASDILKAIKAKREGASFFFEEKLPQTEAATIEAEIDEELFLAALAWWIKHPFYPINQARLFIRFLGGYFIMHSKIRKDAAWLVKYLPLAPRSAIEFHAIAMLLWEVEMILPADLHNKLESLLKQGNENE